jgi:hypothetical protein
LLYTARAGRDFQFEEEVLDTLVHQLVLQMVERSRSITSDPALRVMDKARLILRDQAVQVASAEVMEDLHLPENRELHERINLETIREFGPMGTGGNPENERRNCLWRCVGVAGLAWPDGGRDRIHLSRPEQRRI